VRQRIGSRSGWPSRGQRAGLLAGSGCRREDGIGRQPVGPPSMTGSASGSSSSRLGKPATWQRRRQRRAVLGGDRPASGARAKARQRTGSRSALVALWVKRSAKRSGRPDAGAVPGSDRRQVSGVAGTGAARQALRHNTGGRPLKNRLPHQSTPYLYTCVIKASVYLGFYVIQHTMKIKVLSESSN
jgi:hypothetical protein